MASSSGSAPTTSTTASDACGGGAPELTRPRPPTRLWSRSRGVQGLGPGRPSPPAAFPARWISVRARIKTDMNATHSLPRPIVHLELHTPDQAAASAFYARLLSWRPELIKARSGSYLALEVGGNLGGG